jgi:hypothetical protein
MQELFASYWWLMFPIGGFLFGAWDRRLAYKRSRDHLDLIRAFAAQGKEVPPELMQRVRDEANGGAPPPGYAPGGPGAPDGSAGYGYWGYPGYMRRAWGGYYRWGPYWQWRRVVILAALAAGFWWASVDAGWPGTEGPFRVVAIILTVICAGRFVGAVMSSSFRDK